MQVDPCSKQVPSRITPEKCCQESLAYGDSSVATGNVGWFGEDVTLPEKQEDKKLGLLRSFFKNVSTGIKHSMLVNEG